MQQSPSLHQGIRPKTSRLLFDGHRAECPDLKRGRMCSSFRCLSCCLNLSDGLSKYLFLPPLTHPSTANSIITRIFCNTLSSRIVTIGEMSIGILPAGVFERSFLTGFNSGSVSILIVCIIFSRVGFCQKTGNQLTRAFAIIRNSIILKSELTAFITAYTNIFRQPLGPKKTFIFKLISEIAHNCYVIRSYKVNVSSNLLNAATKSINCTI